MRCWNAEKNHSLHNYNEKHEIHKFNTTYIRSNKFDIPLFFSILFADFIHVLKYDTLT